MADDINYGIYAELIAEEFLKRRGVQSAHYDLVKFLDENGQEVLGVLSESVVDPKKGEFLRSLRSLIGDEPDKEEDENGLANVTSLDFTLDRLSDVLYEQGYEDDQIEKILTDYQKRLLLDIEMINTDNHTENVAFIEWVENGKKMIRMAPHYDSESTFMLDINEETIIKLLGDYENLRQSVDFADPRIGTFSSKEYGGHEILWKDTLVELCYDDTIASTFKEWQTNPVDMDEVLEAVEQRIGTELPENVKLMARNTYDCRNKDMGRVMNIHQRSQPMSSLDSILSILVNRSTDVRTGEQTDIEGKMVRDLKSLEVKSPTRRNEIDFEEK